MEPLQISARDEARSYLDTLKDGAIGIIIFFEGNGRTIKCSHFVFFSSDEVLRLPWSYVYSQRAYLSPSCLS